MLELFPLLVDELIVGTHYLQKPYMLIQLLFLNIYLIAIIFINSYLFNCLIFITLY